MIFTPLTDQQQQYYEQQEALWRAYVKQCCDRNDLEFLTYAEWLFIQDSEGNHPDVEALRMKVVAQLLRSSARH